MLVAEPFIIDENSQLIPQRSIGKVCQREYRHLDKKKKKNEAAVAYYRALISPGVAFD